MDSVTMRPIGRVETPWPEKFGVPRQSGLAGSARGRLVFEPEFRREEAVRGLEGFSHVWIVFLFDAVKEEEARLSVRPPRLGGNEKVGVFATRSPFRPNRIGLSGCELTGIDHDAQDGPVLLLAGVDLVDGTPVLDVKPYLPFADRIEGATGSFAEERPAALTIEVAADAADLFAALPATTQAVIRESLQWDARPAYHEEERTYYLRVEDLEVAWRVRAGVCRVIGVSVHEERN